MKSGWMADPDRAPWVANSLTPRIKDLRQAQAGLRRAFRQKHFGEMADWLADAYAEAAAILEGRLSEIRKAQATATADYRKHAESERLI